MPKTLKEFKTFKEGNFILFIFSFSFLQMVCYRMGKKTAASG